MAYRYLDEMPSPGHPPRKRLLYGMWVVLRTLAPCLLWLTASPAAPAFNQPGSVQMTTPAAGSSYLTGQTITLSASAADADGIAKVGFYRGTTLIAEQAGTPYNVNWNTRGLAAGSYSITARLHDNLGNVTNSAAITVQLTAPTANQPVFYRAINLNGNQVVLDNYQWEGASATNYNYVGSTFTNNTATLSPATDAVRATIIRASIWRHTALQLNLTTVPSGTYQVYLYVWEDSSPETYSIQLEGRTVESDYYSGTAGTWKKLGPYQSAITDGTISLATTGGAANFSGIEVWQVPAGNQAGTVVLTSPGQNQFVTTGQSLTLTATASDPDGTARVEFYCGATKVAEDAASPYEATWNTTGFAGGGYQLTARVVDNVGAITASSPVALQLVDNNVSSLFSRGLNLNGGAITVGGNAWEGSTATNYTSVGTAFVNTTTVFSPQPDAATTSMLRDGIWHTTGLQLNLNSVTNGTYLVYLYTFEDNTPATFSLNLEGQAILRNYTTGPGGWWAKLGPFQVTVNDGALNLTHSGGHFMLSGVEMWQVTGPSNQPPTLGLQAYWPFNASNTLGTDASGKGYTGTLYDGPAWTAGGRVGGSMEMPDSPTLGRRMWVPGLTWQPTQFSVSWWLYPESYKQYNQMLTAGAGAAGFAFFTDPAGGVYVGTDPATRLTPKQLPAGTVKLHQWQHLTFTFDNGTGKFYRNGQLLATKTGLTNPVPWGGFLVGVEQAAYTIHGMVDEVRIYNRPLLDAEISRTANAYTSLVCTWSPNATTTAWGTAGNWTEGRVPTANDDVVVNACTTCPALAGTTRVNNISLNAGSFLDLKGFTFTAGNVAQLYYGSLGSTNGTFRATSMPVFERNAIAGPITIHRLGTSNWIETWGRGNEFFGGAVTIMNGSPVYDEQNNVKDGLGNILDIQGDNTFRENTNFIVHGFGLRLGYGPGTNLFVKDLNVTFNTGSYWVVDLANGRYRGNVTLNNASGGTCALSNNNVFEQKVSLINPHPAFITYLTYGNSIRVSDCSTCTNTFQGPVEVTNTSQRRDWYAPVDITFGNNGGQTLFTPAASLIPVAGSFRRGNLVLKNCAFQTGAATTFNLSSGLPESYTSTLVIGGGTSFAGNLTVTTPRLQLNGATFAGTAFFTKTGAGADNSVGGNLFRGKTIFTNQAGADAPLNLATQQDDVVQE